MTMNIEPFSKYEFYIGNDPIPKSGIAIDINENKVSMQVLHGELHGDLVIVDVSDIIDDSFDSFELGDEKLYAWDNGD
jgi:hypothetical protein